MADEGNVISDLNLGNGEDTGPSAGIISQYLKDLSVENPNAPESFCSATAGGDAAVLAVVVIVISMPLITSISS